MVDVAGTELSGEDRELLQHPAIGGVILFARNYSDPEQIRRLCSELLALKRPRLLLAVDHEGGRVQRFRVGFTRIPAMGTLDRLYSESPERALDEARQLAATIGRELGACGIDLCFAPVLDVDHGISQIIGDRAFSSSVERVIALARAFRAGLNSVGMAATGKHFPGHGAVVADSHHELPIDRRKLPDLEVGDLRPFQALVEDGIESLMMAHVRYTAVDELPASLSREWIAKRLRKQWQYNGAVFCDDLSMGGAAAVGDIVERARLALQAGCDMLPVCNNRDGVVQLLAALPPNRSRLSTARLRRLYRQNPLQAPQN